MSLTLDLPRGYSILCLVSTEAETIHAFDSRHGLVLDRSYEALSPQASIYLPKYSLAPC